MKTLKPGTKVVLKADPEEGFPREEGKVIEDDGDMVIVEVFAKYKEDEDDDGIREVSKDQIE